MAKIKIVSYKLENPPQNQKEYILRLSQENIPFIYIPRINVQKDSNKLRWAIRAILTTEKGIIFIPSNSFNEFNTKIVSPLLNKYNIQKDYPQEGISDLEKEFNSLFKICATLNKQISINSTGNFNHSSYFL